MKSGMVLTPRSLRALAGCSRRFYMEHEKRLRTRGGPPDVKDGLEAALCAADAAEAEDKVQPPGHEKIRAAGDGGLWAWWGGHSDFVQRAAGDVLLDAQAILAHYWRAAERGAVRQGKLPLVQVPPNKKRQKPVAAYVLTAPFERGARVAAPFSAIRQAASGTCHVHVRHYTSLGDPSIVQGLVEYSGQYWPHLWVAQQATGLVPDTLVIEVVRTQPPKRPDTVQCRACRGQAKVAHEGPGNPVNVCTACAATGIGGISRAACDTTAEVYAEEIARHPHLREADYADVLAGLRKRPERFAYTLRVPVDPRVIEAWRADVSLHLRVAALYRRTKRWPRDLGACYPRGGGCPFRFECLRPDVPQQRTFERGSDDPLADIPACYRRPKGRTAKGRT